MAKVSSARKDILSSSSDVMDCSEASSHTGISEGGLLFLAAVVATEHTRSFASSDLAAFAVKNKGLKAGPGGRSSVGLFLGRMNKYLTSSPQIAEWMRTRR